MQKSLLDGRGLKLGLFSANCSSGLAATKIPGRWQGTWDDNLRLARLADDVGIDFMLPVARWIGYGGDTNFHGGVLDPVALAAALLAGTSRLFVFATIHSAFHHPVVAAKAMATVDQIGHGRAGLNIVAGWNKPEYDAMGLDLPQEHDDRYALAQESSEVVQRLGRRRRATTSTAASGSSGVWSPSEALDGPCRVERRLFAVRARFAARNADVAFTVVGGPDDGAALVEQVTAKARRDATAVPSACSRLPTACAAPREPRRRSSIAGTPRNTRTGTPSTLDDADGSARTVVHSRYAADFRGRFAGGHGSCPLIGSPDDVAAEIKRFHDAGFGGMTLSFVDYLGELEHFAQEVIRASSVWVSATHAEPCPLHPAVRPPSRGRRRTPD